jgi:hypothetical protein
MKDFDIIVDRASFIKWTEGYLLYRTKTKMVVGDTLANREAEKILKKGGTVLLTIDSKPVSTVRLNKKRNCYEETPLKKEKADGRHREGKSS